MRRENRLDEREREADRREAVADEREALANERESEADLRAKWLDERERSLWGEYGAFQQQLLSTIRHTRAVLAADRQRHDSRLPAAGDHPAYTHEKAAGTVQEPAGGGRLAATLIGLGQEMERAKALRRDAVALIAAVAATEDRIAQRHDALAVLWPSKADRYRRVADEARSGARRAQLILRRCS